MKNTRNSHLFNFDDLHSQAENYLEAVREKARQIVAQAIEDARKEREEILKDSALIRENARQLGFQEGLSQGKQNANVKIQAEVQERVQERAEAVSTQAVTEICAIVEQCMGLREELTQVWEKAFLTLVSRVAGVILRRELKQEPQIELQWIREMLQLCAGENSMVLSLNPEDAELLRGPLDRLVTEFGQLGHLKINRSALMARGDCMLKTENGQLDQRLDVQLARIGEELRL